MINARKLEIDYESYVLDWEEFKDIQLAFLKASVPEAETPTDIAIPAAMHKIAAKYGVKNIISGGNFATEGILPKHWHYNAKDTKYFSFIHKKFGLKKRKTFPFFGFEQEMYYKLVKGIKIIYLLNYVPYAKNEAMELLKKELDWKYYGGKHYESIWTRFYQGYILPEKFGIDKRKAHFSSLICAGQMTREQAIEEMRQPAYDPALLREDRAFVLKKLGLSDEEFEDIMRLPVRDHRSFDTEGSIFHDYPVIQPLRPLWEGFKRWTGWRR